MNLISSRISAQVLDTDCVSDTFIENGNLEPTMPKAARTSALLIDSSRISSRAVYSVVPATELVRSSPTTACRQRGSGSTAILGLA
jgi:DeoR/GlpR family transcriptional regulator of sugar metabolism